jgi:hypothetical protein
MAGGAVAMETLSGFPASDGGGNGTRSYKCAFCGSAVTYSDRFVEIAGSIAHSFTNPQGVRCDFHTFSSCPGLVAQGEATEEYSWFPGYKWSLALCRGCGNHLGWRYESVSGSDRPMVFWGILRCHILTG